MGDQDGELILSDVTKTYEPDNRVLRGVSMTVDAGETVAVVGPSGCGKSTLLNIVGSLDKPTSGSVRLGHTDVVGLGGAELAAFRGRRVGFIFQDHHLLPQLTAVENVLLPSLAVTEDRAAERAADLLERVGLDELADAFPATMSGGERQRVAIARAMMNQPRLLLCDEPTGNLDRETGDRVVSLFLDLAAEHAVTVLMVTHDLALADRFGRCLELRDGALRPASLPSA
ncbi:MAG: ABC transporter ATP-binding protein [Planctomycetota bacterium]